jgi:hypothetical protein
MSDKDTEMLKSHVLNIVKTLENGYFSKDSLEVVFDDSGESEQYNEGHWFITDNDTGHVLDDMSFLTKQEAEDYLENHEGVAVSAYDYLSDVLDIEYIVNGQKEYLGARVLVAFGGPNIWINTRTQQVEGYWWGSQSIWGYSSDEMGLDDALESLYNC